MLVLSSIGKEERGRLATQLAPYFAEVAPWAKIDPLERAHQVLNRKEVSAYWFRSDETTVGFAIVLHLPDDRRELSEFAILPHHRRSGLGQQAAAKLFALHPGVWRMGIARHSTAALAFWGTCLSLLPGVHNLREGAPFTEHQVKSFTFDMKGISDG